MSWYVSGTSPRGLAAAPERADGVERRRKLAGAAAATVPEVLPELFASNWLRALFGGGASER